MTTRTGEVAGRQRGTLMAVAWLGWSAGISPAADRLVPGQFATIQAAINAAVNGDRVLVSAGTYAERIDFLGKAIVVQGAGAATTVIDGGGVGPVVSLDDGEPAAARLQGFTITGGRVTDGDGAGIRMVNSSATVAACVVVDNQGFAQAQGVETRGGGASVVGGSPTFDGVTFESNVVFPAAISGIPKGGGLFVGPGSATIRSCTFRDNATLVRNGGGIVAELGATLTITDTLFDANFNSSGSGGALFLDACTATLTRCTLRNNYAEFGTGGAIGAENGTVLNVIDSVFELNDTRDGGGPGAIDTTDGVTTITRSRFTNNWGDVNSQDPWSIAAQFGRIEIVDSTFEITGAISTTRPGFALIASFGDVVIRGSRFEGNLVSSSTVRCDRTGSVTISDTSFTENLANGSAGAGVFVDGGTFDLRRLTFTDNRVPGGSGGGVYLRNTSGTLSDSTFTGHVAQGGSGAAIRLQQNVMGTFERLTIDRSAEARAFDVAQSAVTVRDVTLRNNSFGAFRATNNSAVTVERATFVDNFAQGASGGGFSVDGSTFVVSDSLFRNNESPFATGGAVFVIGTASGRFDRCTFSGNGDDTTVGLTSGGFGAVRSTGSATFENCVMFGNGGASGSLRVTENASATLINCTLVDNVPGPGESTVLVSSSSAGLPARVTIANSILRGDTTGGRLMLRQSGTNTQATVEHSNVEGGATGVGNINASPLFANRAAGQVQLLAGSPGIDAGSNLLATATTDLAGNLRYQDDPSVTNTGVSGGLGGAAVIDMGALERSASCLVDLTGDGTANIFDIFAFFNAFGAGNVAVADITGDGVLNVFDIFGFFNLFALGC